jgi:hypothetical protein
VVVAGGLGTGGLAIFSLWRLLLRIPITNVANEAKVVVGESAVTAAPFLPVLGGHLNPFGGHNRATN